MRLLVLSILLASALQQKGCGLNKIATGGNESARSSAEQAIRSYFPAARAVIDQGRQTLVVYTCTDLGKAAVDMMPEVLQPKMKMFDTWGARIFTNLRAFELAFPSYAVQYDISAHRMEVVPTGIVAGYNERYTATCAALPNNDVFIFVGNFRASLRRNTDGREEKTEVRDTLGIYKDVEFESAKEKEINARHEIISDVFAKQGFSLLDLELLSVQRLPFTRPLSPFTGEPSNSK